MDYEKRNHEIWIKYHNRVSICKIAKEYNISRQRVYQIVLNLGPTRKRIGGGKVLDYSKIEKVKTDFLAGMKNIDIIKKEKISPAMILKYAGRKNFKLEGFHKCADCKIVKPDTEMVISNGKITARCKICNRIRSKKVYALKRLKRMEHELV
jgi:predicted DNA-binding protein YlxM (UPF0122 family)